MAKADKKSIKKPRPNKYAEKVGIKGDFEDVFKVIKAHKELKSKGKKP